MNYNPKEVRRLMQISFALEPMDDKPGLTNRYVDYNEFTKLQYFITAAINIGDAFEELAKRILNGKPSPYYDLCLKAQQDSMKNRGGYKLNYGSIIANFPLVLTQFKIRPKTVEEWLSEVPNVLKEHTTNEDCIYLQQMRNFAYKLCPLEENSPNIKDTKNFNYDSVFDYYQAGVKRVWDKRDYTGQVHYSDGKVRRNRVGGTGLSDIEITEGFPVLLEMWNLYQEMDGEVYERITKIWKHLVNKYPNNERYLSIWLADLSTSLYYIVYTSERWK